MKKLNKKRLLIIIGVIIAIIALLLIITSFNKADEKIINVVDTLKKYNYSLEDRDNKIYKDEYNKLKEILESNDVDYKLYAESISKLFVIDLFTLENKISKYDVGGSEFVYPDNLDNYKLNVENTLYKIIENNTDGKRDQELPTVASIIVDSVEESNFIIGEDEYQSYVVTLNWDYEKDYGYDTKAVIISIMKDEKLYIVEYKVAE